MKVAIIFHQAQGQFVDIMELPVGVELHYARSRWLAHNKGFDPRDIVLLEADATPWNHLEREPEDNDANARIHRTPTDCCWRETR